MFLSRSFSTVLNYRVAAAFMATALLFCVPHAEASIHSQSAKATAQKSQRTAQKTALKPSATKNSQRSASGSALSTRFAEEKNTLKSKQKTLQGQISDIQKDISQKESRITQANNELRKSEKAISEANRKLRQLGEKQNQIEKRLESLAAEAKRVNIHVQDANSIISNISQAQFMNSRRQAWQSAIEGGNPNEINRMSAILSYMAKEQDRIIDRLENRQKNIDLVTEKVKRARAELSKVLSDQQKNRVKLVSEQKERQSAISRLKTEVQSQKEHYEQLVKNDERLSSVISSLDKQIQAEKQRLEKLASERAERERQARLAAQKAAQQAKLAKTQQEKKRAEALAREAEQRRAKLAAATPVPVSGSFGALKGKLTMPLDGPIVAQFGQKREGAASQLSWKGILIRGRTGQNVLAAAPGTVVYSDWMRGYGNLLIIDHGSNYLSVYANNESLYKSVGEAVKQGEVIAGAGNSGGEETSGLYFELRHKGKPFNPTQWIARK